MRKQLNKIISRLKGRSYEIDGRIPSSYLFSLAWAGGIMRIRGYLSGVKSDGFLFIGRNVTLKARSLITTGKGVTIQSGCYIDALSTAGIVFGNNVSAGKKTRIECTGNLQMIGKGMAVGDNVGLGSDNFFGAAGGIEIGDDCILGNFISFHSENHNYSDPSAAIRLQGVTRIGIKVGKNCWIGSKAIILDGAVIEGGCIIAAGSVVKAGVYHADGIYGGVPATFIKKRF
ncbi:MAG: acyltransferase [Chitinophagaceae bacterium]|nr:acyltransferase [Chitinophagaceae bacterium]